MSAQELYIQDFLKNHRRKGPTDRERMVAILHPYLKGEIRRYRGPRRFGDFVSMDELRDLAANSFTSMKDMTLRRDIRRTMIELGWVDTERKPFRHNSVRVQAFTPLYKSRVRAYSEV